MHLLLVRSTANVSSALTAQNLNLQYSWLSKDASLVSSFCRVFVLIFIPSEIEKAGGKPFIMVDQAIDHRQYMVRASQVVLVVKSLPTNGANLREAGSIPGSGRSPGGGNDNPLWYPCLEKSMDRGAW